MDRRDFLKNFGFLVGGVVLAPSLLLADEPKEALEIKKEFVSRILLGDIVIAHNIGEDNPVSFLCIEASDTELRFMPIDENYLGKNISDYEEIIVVASTYREGAGMPESRYAHEEQDLRHKPIKVKDIEAKIN